MFLFFFFQAEDGIRDFCLSRGLGDVYKRQGLKEAKEVVDGAPKMVKEGASKAEAEDIKTKLEAEGAKVTLK